MLFFSLLAKLTHDSWCVIMAMLQATPKIQHTKHARTTRKFIHIVCSFCDRMFMYLFSTMDFAVSEAKNNYFALSLAFRHPFVSPYSQRKLNVYYFVAFYLFPSVDRIQWIECLRRKKTKSEDKNTFTHFTFAHNKIRRTNVIYTIILWQTYTNC